MGRLLCGFSSTVYHSQPTRAAQRNIRLCADPTITQCFCTRRGGDVGLARHSATSSTVHQGPRSFQCFPVSASHLRRHNSNSQWDFGALSHGPSRALIERDFAGDRGFRNGRRRNPPPRLSVFSASAPPPVGGGPSASGGCSGLRCRRVP